MVEELDKCKGLGRIAVHRFCKFCCCFKILFLPGPAGTAVEPSPVMLEGNSLVARFESNVLSAFLLIPFLSRLSTLYFGAIYEY